MRTVFRAALIGFALLALSGAPSAVAAQGLSLAARAGTTGVGGEVILALAPKLSLRGGAGVVPFDGRLKIGHHRHVVELSPVFLTGSIDIRVAGPVRVMAGLLHRTDDTRFYRNLGLSATVGDEVYEGGGRLEGALVADRTAPFIGLGLGGFGRRGLALYLDAGLAVAGDSDVELTASGPITDHPGFADELERERRLILDDVGTYHRYWPILNLGFRFGF